MSFPIPHRPSGRFRVSGPHTPRALAPAVLALALGACAVGPEFRSPELAAEAGYRSDPLSAETVSSEGPTGDAQRFREGEAVASDWWTAFGNAELTRRVELALANNPSLASAQAALRKAREEAVAAGGARWPSLDANLGATRQNVPTTVGGSGSPYTVHAASLDIGYTLDLFGGVRRGIEAAEAQAEFQRFQYEGARLSLSANVLATSIQEAALRERIRATEDIVASFGEQAEMVEMQFKVGARSQADVLLAAAQVAQARADLPMLHKALDQTQTQLATYLGRFPSQAELEALDLDAIQLPGDVPVSLPSALVRRRPDIRAAEALLHAATARVGIATANLFPQIGLSASFGSQAATDSDLFGSSAEAWSLGLNLLQPIFRGGSLRAQKRAAEAGLDQAAADYRNTVLTGFQGVADSLRALERDAESLAAREAAARASEESLSLTRRQFGDGSVDYLQVLEATRQFQQARLAVIEARSLRLSDSVGLFAALGGGYDATSQAAPLSASTGD